MPRFFPFIAGIATMTTLAACQPEAEETPKDDSCNAADYVSLIGTPASQADFSQVDNLRIVAPNTPVTRDYRPDRLNVLTDADGIIQELTCG